MRWVNETRFVDGEAYLLSYDPKGSICSNERGAQGNPVFSDGPEGRDVPGVCLTHGDAQTVSVYRQDKNVMPLESLDFARDYEHFQFTLNRLFAASPFGRTQKAMNGVPTKTGSALARNFAGRSIVSGGQSHRRRCIGAVVGCFMTRVADAVIQSCAMSAWLGDAHALVTFLRQTEPQIRLVQVKEWSRAS